LPEGWILDGELYNHEYKDDFNKIMSLIKKQKPTKEELFEAEKKVQYWVYDILTGEDDQSTESERIKRRDEWFEKIDSDVLVRVPSVWVKDQEHYDKVHEHFLSLGYEGTMARMPEGKYKRAGRSQQLLKRKDFEDDEFKILDIEEGKGNRSNMAGAVICSTPRGLVFGAGIKGDEKLRLDLWNNKEKYIGKMATITFFGYTKKEDGVPRFPVYKGINERN